ncbi:MAG: hypothetical protein ACLTS6_11110 [Anaerobutyricum sp.]
MTKIAVPELTGQLFLSGIFVDANFDISSKLNPSDIVEIHLPHDILYMPKYYISQYNMLMAKKALQDFKCPGNCACTRQCKRIVGEVMAALRYLYLRIQEKHKSVFGGKDKRKLEKDYTGDDGDWTYRRSTETYEIRHCHI